MSAGSIWREFEHDPRDPSYAGMRASDRDRAVVNDLLASAYADGRLDRDELDERSGAVSSAKTYAELLPPIRDLTADAVPARFATVAPTDVRRSAEVYFAGQRRDALMGFLVPNLICWAIWLMTGHSGFLWPLFVAIPTGINLLRVLASRQEIVEKRVEKLQRRQAKALETPEAQQSGPIVGEAERSPVRETDDD
ncbi:DUF1707 SHOCT-like domain-containing protein [Nocardioides cynanchi]|uniref:DUF1707 SHOCT-like domain-containing protein n=1 Tax=Nocardioides cynanchi TaxID=2558918 RepID=UPI00192D6B1E|nr:DUF1707 domain-containing protein [Nocardioides cynanchi]